jgi:hypothetical protein
MTGGSWISLIALSGWLVLALTSYRMHRVGARNTLIMGTAWLAIFLLVTGIVAAVGT